VSTKTFRPLPDRRQRLLLPPSLDEWLPQDHLAYFVLDVVEQLDLSAIYAHYERELRGYPPHEPKMMTALLLYGYCVGVPSSRKIERRTHEDVAFRLIACGQHPDHTCISEFRRIHLAALTGLFAQGLVLCQKAGLVKLGHVALDGTKMKANASKHKAMSYDRMKEREAELAKKVEELMQAAEAADAEEDARYGKGRRGDELPEDLRRAESRLAKIRAAKAELEAEAKQQKEAEKKKDSAPPPAPGGPTPLPSHRIPSDAEGTPAPKAQRNFTDAESRIQKSSDGFVQGYNCQAAVDEEHQIITAQAVTNQPPDCEHLAPMVEQVIANCGEAPKAISADAGYFSEENVKHMERLETDPHIATGRRKHNEPAPRVRGRPRADLSVKERMARKLATKKGAAVYARRKAVVEPVFGQIKQARGFRQFLLRGIEKVRAEWALMCMTHNLLKLHRAAEA
jgi:transposase/IS5 family transposase